MRRMADLTAGRTSSDTVRSLRELDPKHAGVMIDRPGAVDRDDAVWVEPAGDGWRAFVHIADVARVIEQASPADVEAARRGWSIYRPDRTIRMLPAGAERAAALTGESRRTPTCLIGLRIAADGAITSSTISRGRLECAVPMGHEQATQALASPGGGPVSGMLAAAHDAARVLLARRRAAGALAVYDLLRGWATTEEGHLIQLAAAERNAAYVIVQELMIAANEAAARWCASREMPILYRNHRAAAVAPPRDHLLQDLTAGLLTLGDARQQLIIRPAAYGPHLAGHYGLNVPAYTHATSPLRRYADLVNQRIILAAVDRRPAPYTTGQLQAIADAVNAHAAEARERKRMRLKDAAKAEHRHQLEQGAYRHLDPDAFHKILKVAAKENRLTPALAAEIGRRAESSLLAARDLCQILFRTDSQGWQPIKQRALQLLTDDPAQAITLVAMAEQMGERPAEAAEPAVWGITNVGTIHQPTFAATVTVTTGGQACTSPRRIAASKCDARQQAALAVVADIAGLPDPSTDLAEIPPPAQASAPVDAPAAHRNPAMTINEHAQTGRLRDLTWDYTASGTDHQPLHTCTATATCAATGRQLTASGQALTKAAAKTAAAAALLTDLEEGNA